jgi:hypothetical protein
MHYVYFVYNCINKTLYSNQSNPVNLLYIFSEIIFIMLNLIEFYLKLYIVIIRIKRL